ncbi:MAG: LytTR family DNA-binding domain-containing protein [Spirosomataceae bacterium]
MLNDFQAPLKTYQSRFLVSRGEKIMSVLIDQIAYFEGEDRYVYLIKRDGMKYIIDYKLSELENLLDPKQFYRLNRSFIAHFLSIRNIFNISKSRVKIELDPFNKREVIVSSENTQDFKAWLNQ